MRIAICAVLTVIAFAACSRQQQSWKDRMPATDCEPRTARAKAELGPIPKLPHFEHPTLTEQQEIVRYLNQKNAIEGTIIFGDYYQPGCLTWSVDPNGDVPNANPTRKPGCGNDLEQKLRDFNIPPPKGVAP
jgi:hypothetical protein